jgi:hypothetical protein
VDYEKIFKAEYSFNFFSDKTNFYFVLLFEELTELNCIAIENIILN